MDNPAVSGSLGLSECDGWAEWFSSSQANAARSGSPPTERPGSASPGIEYELSGAVVETFSHPIAAGRTGYVAAGGLHNPLDSTCEFFACPSEEAVIWTSPDGRS